jgi:xylulokinase
MYLMGLDVGSSACKAAIFSFSGEPVSLAKREYPMYHPEPAWSELNPDEVWSNLVACIKESLQTAQIDSENVVSLSVSSQGEAMIPLDQSGKWLYPAIHAFDNRTLPQSKWWEQHFGALPIFRITGMPIHPMYTVNKIMWLRENRPDVWLKTKKFLCFEDYVIYRLSGEVATDYSIASRTMMFNVTRKRWSEEILDAADISTDLLPDAYPSGTKVGEVCSGSAEETGLPKGMAVVTGGHDQPCGALGVGVVKPGSVMDATGTVECLLAATEKPLLNEGMLASNHPCYCHVKEGMYVTLALCPTAGLLFRWIRDEFCEKEMEESRKTGKSAYDIMTEEAALSPVGASSVYVLPYFMGSGTPTVNPDARGVILGLHISHNKKDIIRAALEGITYDLRQNIELLESHGVDVTTLRAIGGGAESKFWLQLKADITGKKVVVPRVTEAAVLGASLLAGVGVGVYRNLDQAVEKVYREREVYMPNERNYSRYNELFEIYKLIFPTIFPIFERMSSVRVRTD